MDFEGYGQAVIHLAWFRNDALHYLLFGMVELRPLELPRVPGCSMKDARCGSRGRKYVYYQRFAASVDDAHTWYRNAIDGCPSIPTSPKHTALGDEVGLQGGPFDQEPPWPELVASIDLAVAPDWMQGAQAHFLFPRSGLSRESLDALANARIRKKLAEWLNFDIVDVYPEYQGAICLIAPNPLFRSVEKSHLEHPHPGFAESVAYKIVCRAGQRPDGLRLEVVNERPCGRMKPFVHEFDDDPIAVFNSPAEVYKEGQTVMHPDYGLLSRHEPLPLARTINVGMGLASRRKRVHVPPGGGKRRGYSYDVVEVEDSGGFTLGEARPDADIVTRFAASESRRTRRQAAEDNDQHWFHRAPANASAFVRDKIGDARDSILIVDPYFAGLELLAFGHARQRSDVEMQILTSARCLKQPLTDAPGMEVGARLQRALDETFLGPSRRPEIRVLSGKMSPVHDRFLVVDENIWLSGNSFGTLGERAGMIIRLPDPVRVIAELKEFWSKAQSLAAWLTARQVSSRKG